MKYDVALVELRRRLAPGRPPVLTDADYTALLRSARRPDRYGYLPDNLADWIAGAIYPVGAAVRPTIPNGHFYILVDNNSGAVASEEPADWPLQTGEQVTTTGDGYTWQEAGIAAYVPTYDLDSAAADGWMQKAALSADAYNLSDNGLSLSRDQIYVHCERQAKYWRRKIQEMIPTGYGQASGALYQINASYYSEYANSYRIGLWPNAGVVVPLDNGPYLP
jgi:hypothetical protein